MPGSPNSTLTPFLRVSCIRLSSRRRIPLVIVGILQNLVHRSLANGFSAVVYSALVLFAGLRCWSDCYVPVSVVEQTVGVVFDARACLIGTRHVPDANPETLNAAPPKKKNKNNNKQSEALHISRQMVSPEAPSP